MQAPSVLARALVSHSSSSTTQVQCHQALQRVALHEAEMYAREPAKNFIANVGPYMIIGCHNVSVLQLH